jgi:hypothetical protein
MWLASRVVPRYTTICLFFSFGGGFEDFTEFVVNKLSNDWLCHLQKDILKILQNPLLQAFTRISHIIMDAKKTRKVLAFVSNSEDKLRLTWEFQRTMSRLWQITWEEGTRDVLMPYDCWILVSSQIEASLIWSKICSLFESLKDLSLSEGLQSSPLFYPFQQLPTSSIMVYPSKLQLLKWNENKMCTLINQSPDLSSPYIQIVTILIHWFETQP